MSPHSLNWPGHLATWPERASDSRGTWPGIEICYQEIWLEMGRGIYLYWDREICPYWGPVIYLYLGREICPYWDGIKCWRPRD